MCNGGIAVQRPYVMCLLTMEDFLYLQESNQWIFMTFIENNSTRFDLPNINFLCCLIGIENRSWNMLSSGYNE